MGILRKNDTERYPIVYRIQTGWAPIGCRPCRQKRGAENFRAALILFTLLRNPSPGDESDRSHWH